MPADGRERKPEAVAVPHESARGLLLAEEVGISRPTHTRSLWHPTWQKTHAPHYAVPTSCGSGPQSSPPSHPFWQADPLPSALERLPAPRFRSHPPSGGIDRLL